MTRGGWPPPAQDALPTKIQPSQAGGFRAPCVTRKGRTLNHAKIGNATLRSSLYMPALSAMRYNPAIAALVARLKSAGRLKSKQTVVAAMRKLLVLGFGVLKTGKRFDRAIAMST